METTMKNFKMTQDHWDLLGSMAKVFCMVGLVFMSIKQSYDYGYMKGVASVKGTYLTPSVHDVDIQCSAWLFDIGGSQAKARICKK